MKKHWLFTTLIALALCVVCFALLPTEAKAASVDDLTFTLNEDGKSYSVSKCDTYASGTLEIPSTYNGLPVTSIGFLAFSNCSNLTSVNIPDSVTSVVLGAFYNCTSLSNICVPDSVTSVGYGAFDSCPNLTYNIYSNGKYLGNATNPYCVLMDTVSVDMTTFKIHKNTNNIYNHVFSKCVRLQSIAIPDGVTSIGNYAFNYCTSLESITIPGSVNSIGENAFSYCSSLASITIPKGVTSIGESTFKECDSLEKINIPEGVSSIGDSAFYGCASLTDISIPSTLTSIGSGTFLFCSNLTDVYITDPSAWCKIAFEADTSNPMIQADRVHLGNQMMNVVLDETVTAIPEGAFKRCDNLLSISIPDSVTSIGVAAFQECPSLLSVTIGNGVTSICNDTFSECKKLISAIIGNGVTSIGEDAFYNCNSLESVTIPDSVTSIDKCAFDFGNALRNVYYSGTESQWNKIDIHYKNYDLSDAKIHYKHTHDYSRKTAVKVAATCTENGYTQYTCVHGEKHRDNYVPALGHKFGGKKTVVAPTCTKDGYTKVKCTRCTETKRTKSVDFLGHSMVYKTEVAETCTKDGHTEGTVCTRCGCLGTAVKIEKEHKYKTTTTKATLSKNGSVVKKCTVCDKVASKKTIKYVKTIKLSETSYTYNGKVKTPTVTVKDSAGKTLKKGTDYDVTYASGCKKAGTYKVTIKFKGNYSGTKTLTFKILPAAKVATQPKTNKVKVGEKIKFTVKATGTGLKYQWQYSTNGKTWKNCSASAAKKASFSFTSKTSHDGNYYRCKVTDSAGNVVYTKVVRAYVLGIEKQPVKKTVTKNKTAKFSVEASGNGLKYQWQYSTDGGKTWKTCSGTAAQKAAFSFKAKISQNGYYFRCKITDSAKNVIYTSKVKLTVKK